MVGHHPTTSLRSCADRNGIRAADVSEVLMVSRRNPDWSFLPPILNICGTARTLSCCCSEPSTLSGGSLQQRKQRIPPYSPCRTGVGLDVRESIKRNS